jgi:hypothetical protein
MTDEPLRRLRARIDALARHADDGPILEDKGLAEARHLLGRHPGRGRDDAPSDTDIEALRTVALFHWYRYCVLESDDGREDFDLAASLFTRLHQLDPAAVPEQLYPLVDTGVDPQAPEDAAESLTWASLAGAFRDQYEASGDPGALRRAIALLTAELDAGPDSPSEQFAVSSQLVKAMLDLHQLTGDPAALREAAQIARAAAVASPDGSPQRPAALSQLASLLLEAWSRSGEPELLLQALQAAREAAGSVMAEDPARPAYLSNLAAILLQLWNHSGEPAALDEAIVNLQAAVTGIPTGPGNRETYLSNLGIALLARFEHTGNNTDLDEAIAAGRDAVAATPAGHPDWPGRLSNLGIGLLARFERTGAMADLDASIEAARSAVAAAPGDHPRRAAMLSNLGNALRARFARSGASSDLDEAIAAGRDAVAATPAGHPDWPGRLSNLGNALRVRSEYTGMSADLDASIEAARSAVAAAPGDHPRRAAMLSNLGNALRARFESTGAPADRNAALTAYAQATDLVFAAPSTRIYAARRAAELAAPHEPRLAARLLETAVHLLPEVAPRMLERSDQQHALRGMAGLASDAAALALADTGTPEEGRAARALRLLEAGRAVLLSQALDTRSDLADLRQAHPGLAARFAELRDQLDLPTNGFALEAPEAEVVSLVSDVPVHPVQQLSAVQQRRDLARQWDSVLAEIRSLDGFAAFARPADISQFLDLGGAGPVVTFNVSTYRSDALLLTPDGITAVELPALSPSELLRQISTFHRALEAAEYGAPAARTGMGEVLAWLWDAAAEPVLDALGYRDQPPPGTEWPRVWWAPGGLLGLLPLHAAGYHDGQPGERGHRTVMDRVISSYTPTLRALRHARLHAPADADPGRALIVAMSTTPGLPAAALPWVPRETDMLTRRLPSPVLLTTESRRQDRLPTSANVLASLPGSAIAHFACHSISDPVDPSRSMLLLQDHDRHPLTVAGLASLRLERAQLAYLSACSTARTGTAELADEAIHLTSAFQLAGYPHVIGTLWAIDDRNAMKVADVFYAHLATSLGNIDTTRAADALHHAIRAMRDRFPEDPFLWAGYLHSGA